ncbi:guanine nucleotide binding protein, alpha subunit, partial [Cantharellus anzutake]|uniref:guanine nucleotide binding protein, alpha subunit n=1 Tax=Cantharellus anzutake TaxID=1750568 RepID=UPI001906BA24
IGQSESGKSTLQKQFQILYAPQTLESERAAWRGIIYVNVIATVRQIFEVVEPTQNDRDYVLHGRFTEDDRGKWEGPSRFTPSPAGEPSAHVDLLTLRYRLSPLMSVESTLAERLGAGFHVDGETGSQEMFVRRGWQQLRPRGTGSEAKARRKRGIPEGRPSLEIDEQLYEASRLIEACKDDIHLLWNHPTVQRLMMKGRIVVKESSDFFMNEIDRISSLDFVPTNDDILYARIRTVGIAEYTYQLQFGAKMRTWRIVDVGGTRRQRHAWIPYFDNATAIIFLCPVSAFDQWLDEDPTTNRIEDSMKLFSIVCSSPLLKRTHIVLFLNKIDILKEKLKNGAKVRKSIPTYGNRENDVDTVVKYFQSHFQTVFRKSNPPSESGHQGQGRQVRHAGWSR